MMMFGMELKDTRKMAVVMNVSRSMTSYLPLVAKELDKVAKGSPLVLYFGCGLKTPPGSLEGKARKMGDEGFDKFWYFWEGKHDMGELRKDYAKLKLPGGGPMPPEAIYNQMKNRPDTYFIDFNGITHTSSALICKEVMEAGTIYLFANFQDAVDVEHGRDIVKKLAAGNRSSTCTPPCAALPSKWHATSCAFPSEARFRKRRSIDRASSRSSSIRR